MTTQVLLLNSDRPEIMRVLRARADVAVRIITRPDNAELYRDHPVALVDSFADLTQVQRAAHELAAHGPVDHVIAATEKSVVAAGLVRGLLGVPGPGFDLSLSSAHKRAMKDVLRAAGLPVAKHAQAATISDVPRAALRTGWPVVIKPVFGVNAMHTFRVDTLEELGEHHRAGTFADLEDLRLPIQVERAVYFSHEYHCDGVVQGGGVTHVGLSRYSTPPLGTSPYFDSGYVADQAEPFSLEVFDLHRRVVAALGLEDGVTHLEVFRTTDGPVVGEVAIRPGGCGISRLVWHAFGFDPWEELVRVSLGEAPTQPGREPLPHVVGRTRLPAVDGLLEQVAAFPGVIEVLDPEGCGSPGCLEVFFETPDEAAAEALITDLHARAVTLGEAAMPVHPVFAEAAHQSSRPTRSSP